MSQQNVSQTFAPGELVDITIQRALVLQTAGDRLEFSTSNKYDHRAWVPLHGNDRAKVTVVSLAPAEWPPRPGDLWTDRDGEPHFCVPYDDRAPDEQCLYGAEGEDRYASTVLRERGPMKLVYRVGGVS